MTHASTIRGLAQDAKTAAERARLSRLAHDFAMRGIEGLPLNATSLDALGAVGILFCQMLEALPRDVHREWVRFVVSRLGERV